MEASDGKTRARLIDTWGGVTTARRRDWRRIIKDGQEVGWYRVHFGLVERLDRDSSGWLVVCLHPHSAFGEAFQLSGDFAIDATGLNPDHQANPFLRDLIVQYALSCTEKGGIETTVDFEVEEMRNEQGRVYLAGVTTLGGHYAPVDSFFGLQYAAQRSVDAMASQNAPALQPLTVGRSVSQWWRWARGVEL